MEITGFRHDADIARMRAPDFPPRMADIDTLNAADEHIRRILHYARPTNVHDQCAISLPMDVRLGHLPAGLQITCRKGEDAQLLALGAEVLAAVSGNGHGRPTPDPEWMGG